MGYDLHITRRKNWCDNGDDITRDEFESYVRSDAEFSYPSEMGEDYAEWKSPMTGYQSWLFWQDGQINTKNPEAEFIDKIVAVATQLNATAMGDDGEVYLSATKVRVEPSAIPETGSGSQSKLSQANLVWLAILVVAALLAKAILFGRLNLNT